MNYSNKLKNNKQIQTWKITKVGDIIIKWTLVVCFHHDDNANDDDNETDKQTKNLTNGNLKLENEENENQKIQKLENKKKTEKTEICKWWKLKKLINK